jgi:hypothetical protein
MANGTLSNQLGRLNWMHLTGVVDARSAGVALRDVLDRTGLGRTALESSARYLPAVDTAVRDRLLRY